MREELDLYIRARYSLLWVVTSEEQRALQELDSLAQAQRKPLYFWSATTGIVNDRQRPPTGAPCNSRAARGRSASGMPHNQPAIGRPAIISGTPTSIRSSC